MCIKKELFTEIIHVNKVIQIPKHGSSDGRAGDCDPANPGLNLAVSGSSRYLFQRVICSILLSCLAITEWYPFNHNFSIINTCPEWDLYLRPRRKYSLIKFEISVSQTAQPPRLDQTNKCSSFKRI